MMAVALSGVAFLVLAYILIGYPILLAVSRRRPAPAIRKDPGFRVPVTAIIAVRNGAEFISAKLTSLLELDFPRELLQILVVSDGSTDGTDAIVESFAHRGVTLIRIERGGKAAALNAGMRQATGEILFFTDVRQKLRPDALSHLVANFADPSVGVVTGELRFHGLAGAGEQADLGLYWRYEIWARSRHSRLDSIFGATGCIYAIRRGLAEPIPPDTLSDDVAIPLRAFFRGYRVVFEPLALAFDYPVAEGGEFRRRLRTLAGLWQAFARTPALFSNANRMRLHFLSHKFARLIMPWALLALWVATLALPKAGLRDFLVAAEGAPVLLGLLDFFISRDFGLRRITSPARTFLVMNAAALLSVVVFVVPPASLWRTTRVRTTGAPAQVQ